MWLILAGRGWGKTRTGAEFVSNALIRNAGWRCAVVAPTREDARDTCVEGESGLLATIPASCIADWNRSLGELILNNGSRFKLFSAEKPKRLRGPQHHIAWCDELAAWQYPDTWDQLMFGLRLGDDPKVIATTTPSPVKLVLDLYKRRDDDVVLTSGRTLDNAANISKIALKNLLEKYQGTRLGRQELDAELLEDLPGALWQRSVIDKLRVMKAPPLMRVVVAVDPAVSTNDGSDETGIVVVGVTMEKHAYILADYSGIYSPNQWAQRVVAAFHEFKADFVVGEVNQGGDLVESNIQTVDQGVPVKKVHATRNKYVRAEPVASLAEQGRYHHVGFHSKLEDQMCSFTVDFDRKKGGYSPDRMDAMVWGVTETILLGFPGSSLLDYYAQQDAEEAARKALPSIPKQPPMNGATQ